jgi:hypothetical protein
MGCHLLPFIAPAASARLHRGKLSTSLALLLRNL